MRNNFLLSLLVVMFLGILYVPSAYSQSLTQSPTFQIVLSNDHWDGAKIYTVDITLVSTDVNPIEFATTSFGIAFPTNALNGGTVTATWVTGTSGMIAGQQPGLLKAVSGSLNVIKFTGKTPPGWGNGTQILLSPGVRMGTLKLVTSAASWVMTSPNTLDLVSPAIYPPNFNVYIYNDLIDNGGTGTNTDIWPNGTFVRNLTGPLLPVELSSFASAAQGRTVVLNWSTKTEKNSDRFEVERSTVTKESWSTVGTVKASVLSNSPKSYSYTDSKLQSGKYQYRLKMVDNNGTFSYSSVESAEVAIPKDFAVSQNYPNPFNPSTKIDYQVPVDAKVVMEVYNIAGQRVFELVNQEQSAGYYTVDFGASKLSSGVYIYRLSASDKVTGNNFSSIKKMMLLK